MIERVTAAQLDLVVPLFDAYRRFYHQASDLAGASAFLHARQSRGESVLFADLDQGQAFGFAQLYPSFSSISLAPIWILNDLFVVPEARNRGIATTLIQTACQHAKSTGAVRVALATGVENYPAQRLYERLGWRRISGFFNYEIDV